MFLLIISMLDFTSRFVLWKSWRYESNLLWMTRGHEPHLFPLRTSIDYRFSKYWWYTLKVETLCFASGILTLLPWSLSGRWNISTVKELGRSYELRFLNCYDRYVLVKHFVLAKWNAQLSFNYLKVRDVGMCYGRVESVVYRDVLFTREEICVDRCT